MRLGKSLLGVLLAVSLAAPVAARAAEVGGVRFDESQVVQGQSLVLNGVGLRVKMIIKVYAMGLYLPKREATVPGVLAMSGPKNIRIVMLRDVSGERLSESLIEGLRANTPAAEQATLQARVEELEAAMLRAGEARKGVVIELSHNGNGSTRVSMAGKPLLRDIPGEDFYRALLRIWLGDKPSDKDLRDKLLGR